MQYFSTVLDLVPLDNLRFYHCTSLRKLMLKGCHRGELVDLRVGFSRFYPPKSCCKWHLAELSTRPHTFQHWAQQPRIKDEIVIAKSFRRHRGFGMQRATKEGSSESRVGWVLWTESAIMSQMKSDLQELEQGFWDGYRCLSVEAVQLKTELGNAFQWSFYKAQHFSILVHSERLRGALVTTYKHFYGVKSVGY